MIELYTSIREIHQPWDEVVAAAGAPIFYTSAYLDAYENAPLQPVEERAYLVLRNGTPKMVLPVTFMSHADPIGALAGRLPGFEERPTGLLSHIWHCYDSWLPGTATADDVRLVLDRFRVLARDMGAAWYGLVNVDRAGGGAILEEAGLVPLEIDDRYSLDLTRYATVEDYMASIRAMKARNEMRRQARRAAEAGLEVRVTDPAGADWDALFPLVLKTAAKHHNQHFYRDGIFQDFVLRLGPAARVIELRLRGTLIGGAICMVDSRRYHFWTAGVDYAAGGTFSPYYLLTIEGVRDALSLGVPVMECGRRNGGFKTRYGMSRRPLYAYVAPA